MLETVPSLEMLTPSLKDGLVDPTGEEKEAIAGQQLPKSAHDKVKTTSQGELSPVALEKSETKMPSNLQTHALRALLEVDNVQRFKRRRLTPSVDAATPEHISEVQEMFGSLEMPVASVKDRDLEQVLPRREEMGLAGTGMPRNSEHLKSSIRRDLPSEYVEINETKMPSKLGTHALTDLVEADNGQKFKRRRLTTPGDASPVRDRKQGTDQHSPVLESQESNGLSVLGESEWLEGSCAQNDLDGEAELLRIAVGRKNVQDTGIKELTRSGGCDSERKPRDMPRSKHDGHVDSSSGGRSSVHSVDSDMLDKYISRSPKKKEWLAQHHSDMAESGIEQDAGFAGNVGGCYRSAIDKRPAVPHPGFVGDGAAMQQCKVCGETEDATGSLICDSCEEVFHMTCVNPRMKIVPRVDEWLCRPCKKKRKMNRECENQGDCDLAAEPKDWWREDAGIGRLDRELLRMSNGRRMKVRIGPKYQAEVPEWTGVVHEVDLDDTVAEAGNRFGQEVLVSLEEKERERDQAEHNLTNNIWPKGWLPASQLPLGTKENWLQCMLVLYDEGDICPDGRKAEKEIICGKWRRAPGHVTSNDQWECSCALEWDPRHADCAVSQELSTEEINRRRTTSRQQESAL